MTLTEGIFPDTANVSPTGHLAVGGSDLVELAGRYGTPLYVYDEATIRARARAFRTALAGYPARTTVCYAAKAYCAPWILRLAAEEGLGLDVVSSGELHTAALAGFASERISFHGNNKTEDELEMALRLRVGRVVIDNLEEIGRLADRATAAGVRQAVLLRVSPGVTAHTHTHLQTGAVDTKFGFGPDVVGAAARAVLSRPALDLRGLHAHIGSQIGELEPYAASIERVFAVARGQLVNGFDELTSVRSVPAADMRSATARAIRWSMDRESHARWRGWSPSRRACMASPGPPTSRSSQAARSWRPRVSPCIASAQ